MGNDSDALAEVPEDAEETEGLGCDLCIDGYALLENLRDYYFKAGNLDGLNMMCGQVYGESGSYGAETATELYDMIRERYGEELFEKYDIANTMDITDDNVDLPVKADMTNERLFVYLTAPQNENLNFYNFSFARITPGSEIGWHSSGLWYMFASLRNNGLQRDWEEADYATADISSSYWANFIANGDPNGTGLAQWPASAVDNSFAFQYLDSTATTETELTNFDLMVMEYAAQRYGFGFDGMTLRNS